MADTIAIRSPLIFEHATDRSNIMFRLQRALIEGVLSLRKELSNKEAVRIKDEAAAILNKDYKQHMPKRPDNKKQQIRIFVEKNHKKAIDRVVNIYEEYYKGELSESELKRIRAKATYRFETNGDFGITDSDINITVIDLQNIIEKYKKEKSKQKKEFQLSCFHITAAHETIHHFGGFDGVYKKYDLEWLDEGVTEILARNVVGNLYRSIVTDRWDDSYNDNLSAAGALIRIAGKQAVFKAFFSRRIELIIEKLRKIGFREEEIDKIFMLAEKITDKKEGAGFFKELTTYLQSLLRKKRALENQAEEPSEEEQMKLYGKPMEKAMPVIKEVKNLPGEQKEAFRARVMQRLAGQNLSSIHNEFDNVRSIDGLKERLLKNFNGASKFYADLAIGTVTAHLQIEQNRKPEAEEISAFISDAARDFETHHFVKPTLRELAGYLGVDIYHHYSQDVEIMDLVGITDEGTRERIEKEARNIAEKLVSMKTEGTLQQQDMYTLLAVEFDAPEGKVAAKAINDAMSLTAAVSREYSDYEFFKCVLACKEKLGETGRQLKPEKLSAFLRGIIIDTGYNMENVRHIKRIEHEVADEYIYSRYGRQMSNEDFKSINELLRNLSLMNPGLVFTFDKKRGFAAYGHQKLEEGDLFTPKPPGGKGPGSMDKFSPYGNENRFAEILEKHNLPPAINPLSAAKLVESSRQAIPRESSASFPTLFKLFSQYARGGTEGVAFDMNSERPNGCLTPEEVLEKKYALCLEHAYLFLALNKDARNVFAFKIFRDEDGYPIPHISNGVLLPTFNVNQAALEEYLQDTKRPRLFHYGFEADQEFRNQLLGQLATMPSPYLQLLLVDLSMASFGAQYQEIRPLIRDEEILSAYFVDAGSYFMRKEDPKRALQNFESALMINPNDELARSHLIAYFSDIEYISSKVLDLSEDHTLLVNTEDLVSRSLVLISLGKTEEAIEALARAVQMSEYCDKALILLRQLINHGSAVV